MTHSVLIHLFCDKLCVVRRHFSSPLLFGGFEPKVSFASINDKCRERGDVVGNVVMWLGSLCVQIKMTFLERGGLALRNVVFLDVESLIPIVRHVLG